MNKILQYIMLLFCTIYFIGCDKNDKQLFDDEFSGIYFYTNKSFDGEGNRLDSLEFNFQYLSDEINAFDQYLYVTLAGDAKNFDREFKVVVDEEKTTAVEGLHYQKLDDSYTFGKDLFYTKFPIKILRAEDLKENNYDLALSLVPSNDFDLGLGDELSYKIKISDNLLEPPTFWTQTVRYSGGLYHPIKCKKFIEIAGIEDPYWLSYDGAKVEIYIKQTRKWFEDNPTYDENGNRLYFQ